MKELAEPKLLEICLNKSRDEENKSINISTNNSALISYEFQTSISLDETDWNKSLWKKLHANESKKLSPNCSNLNRKEKREYENLRDRITSILLDQCKVKVRTNLGRCCRFSRTEYGFEMLTFCEKFPDECNARWKVEINVNRNRLDFYTNLVCEHIQTDANSEEESNSNDKSSNTPEKKILKKNKRVKDFSFFLYLSFKSIRIFLTLRKFLLLIFLKYL